MKLISEEEIIQCFGSLENYELIATEIVEHVKKEIEIKGIERYFGSVNLLEGFAYPFLQHWISRHSKEIQKVLKIKETEITESDISEFISQNTILLKKLHSKYDELFGSIADYIRENAPEKVNEDDNYIPTREDAISSFEHKKLELIKHYSDTYDIEAFRRELCLRSFDLC